MSFLHNRPPPRLPTPKNKNENAFPIQVINNNPINPCATAIPGTQEQVFCQVQKYPRIVVLPKAYGYLETIELNQCKIIGTVNEPCACQCAPTDYTQTYRQVGNRIVPSENPKPTRSTYNPNPPYPFVPPDQQIRCYNIAATLNQCDVNKSNFINNQTNYVQVWTPTLN